MLRLPAIALRSTDTDVDGHSSQVHTFYEAVGYMIAAHPDPSIQEHLMEKYMSLPNQVWDDVINQASKVSR